MNKRRQRLDLPFVKRRTDPVSWIYDHRAGVFSILALALTMAILFVGSQILVRMPAPGDQIIVDLRTVEELRAEAERLQREVSRRQSEAELSTPVRNAVSNEGADLRPVADRASAVMDRAAQTAGRLGANRDAWDQGLREISQIGGERGTADDNANVNNDTRAKGTVMVSFSLVNPTRYSADLYVPGYRCERGGEVTVSITVSRSGDVTAATVARGSTDDACMHQTALDAARRSRFNIDSAAPERHSGTITYLFIPQ